MQGRSTSIYNIISSVRRSKMAKLKWNTYQRMITCPISSPSLCQGQNLPNSWSRWAWGRWMTPKPSLGAEVRSRLRPQWGCVQGVAEVNHCIKYKWSWEWRAWMWMWMWIIVSNTNDPVGGDHGCGNGLLYQIQTIMLVVTVDVEMGCCIKYKWSCWWRPWMWKWIIVSNTNDCGGDEHWRGVGSLYLIQTILWGRRPRRDNGGGKKKGMVRWFFSFIYYRLMRSSVVTMWHMWPCKLMQLEGEC